MDTPKTFKDFCFTAILVVLASTSGILITRYYQKNDEINKSFITARQEATDVSKSVINALAHRYYFAMRTAVGFQHNTEDQKERWEQYIKQVVEWNKGLFENRASIKRYFGEEVEKQILGFIKEFAVIHSHLTNAKNKWKANEKADSAGLSKLLEEKIYPLDDAISAFSDQLQNQLRDGKVDIYGPKPPLKGPGLKENKDG
jgi:hypothetical protein